MSLIYAPWTDEQVAALNRWQEWDNIHPFTCINSHSPETRDLIACETGWFCRWCDYTQNWAHDFMLNPPRNILVDWDYQDRKKPK